MKYAVVTGASSGIGADFARNLSARGYGLILVARREDRLKTLAAELSTPVEIFTADLSHREECERLGEFMDKFEIGVFINNAGFGDCGAFTESDLGKELQMINVNVNALHVLSKIALKHLQKNSEKAYLLNVGSSAGLLPAGPYMATYYATKAYVVSLSRAIAQELKETKSNVSVSVLCPGPVKTEFNDVANVSFTLPGIEPKFCADYAIAQLFNKKTVIIPGLFMKLTNMFSHIIPAKLAIKITGMQQKKKLHG
ncbi:MAG: SDR family oxidoreductase [Fibrobacter sp.]|nr:SDR family oxidoreductase [Fibrobacter sp.]